ncbi:MAG: hypothetical protein ACJ77U_13455 [Chloroflexota bacterium]
MSGPAATASTERLTFLSSPADIESSARGPRSVVLDPAWAPPTGDASPIASIRAAFGSVVETHDLFEESLELLDAWADETGIADVLLVEGVTYWFRMRESLWHWVHERLLWRYTFAELERAGRIRSISVPSAETALIDVGRALGLETEVRPEQRSVLSQPDRHEPSAVPPSRTPRPPGRSAVIRRFYRRFRRKPPSVETIERRRRQDVLDARLASLAALPGPRVVVLTLPSSYQRIGSDDKDRRDPNLGSVIPAIQRAGLEPVVVGWAMDRKDPGGWRLIEDDDRLLPAYEIQARWARPEDVQRGDAAADAALRSLDAVGASPLLLDGVDVTAFLLETLRTSTGRLIRSDIDELARVERFLNAFEPKAILMTQEGRRTPWVLAGARTGVPTFALQHGVLYPTHPGYPDRRHPRIALPSCTFVFGDYERRVLEGGAYREGEVSVSGSPRLDLAGASQGGVGAERERDAVRLELGVAAGDLLLVVSTVNLPFIRRSHLVHMIESLLAGPLPGVHLVFKQHPGERDEGPYRDLLTRLACAGGYECPPITVVKDIDLYRLLRAADAHLGQHSTVLTDAVVAGTHNLIAMVDGHADMIGYVAAGVARPIRDIDELRDALARPTMPDPEARSAFLDDHFRPGVASERIAAAIRDVVIEASAAGAIRSR